jgi:acyl-CoA dehydrogenase
MLILGLIFLLLILIGVVAYHRIQLKIWSSSLFLILFIYSFWEIHHNPIHTKLIILWILFAVLILPLNILFLRRKFFSQKIFDHYKKMMPKISDTEKEVLRAGTVSWEAELFNGKPNWKKLCSIPAVMLTTEEKNFIHHTVEALCHLLNDWQITEVDKDLPSEVWSFLKTEGFFGLIIPKQYGGKGFSAFAHSEILCKIYGVSVTAATTVSVPNSLGPAELLLRYGTDDQKNYYLPRLAKGEEIPCFALTSPEAGSDANSIIDTGIISYGQFEGKETLGIKLNWNKRYITLAPIATVLGLAFKLYDPDKLIGSEIEYGMTCALIPTHLPGITIGRRHMPLNIAFLNGPTQGQDVFIPIDYIIGGQKMAGQGWRMLMECLSVGRAISLPASAIGGGKAAVFATSAYASIRHQFNLSIGKFEGVADVLARMAGNLYLMEAARLLTLSMIQQGEKPSVLSAIMKYHLTELGRKIACDAMDVHGGKGICLGPQNYLGRYYQSIPIAITVEGANILTRSLIIFGQGAIRCHRYVMAEIQAGENNDLKQFDQALWGHIGQIISNKVRSFFLGLTSGYFVKNPVLTLTTRRYYQLLTQFSSAFAFISETSLIILGSKLKRAESLSGRLGDVFSYLYFISAVLKRYEEEGRQAADLPLVHWTCQQFFYEIQWQLDMILQNLPVNKMIKILLNMHIFPLGKHLKPPSDALSHQIAEIIMKPSGTRDRLTQGIFKSEMMIKMEAALRTGNEKIGKEIMAVDDF